MIRLTKYERVRWAGDIATPLERRWLDKYNEVCFFGSREMKVLTGDRDKYGKMRSVHVMLRRRVGSPFGIMGLTLDYIRKAVRNQRACNKRATERETRNLVGAYI